MHLECSFGVLLNGHDPYLSALPVDTPEFIELEHCAPQVQSIVTWCRRRTVRPGAARTPIPLTNDRAPGTVRPPSPPRLRCLVISPIESAILVDCSVVTPGDRAEGDGELFSVCYVFRQVRERGRQ